MSFVLEALRILPATGSNWRWETPCDARQVDDLDMADGCDSSRPQPVVVTTAPDSWDIIEEYTVPERILSGFRSTSCFWTARRSRSALVEGSLKCEAHFHSPATQRGVCKVLVGRFLEDLEMSNNRAFE